MLPLLLLAFPTSSKLSLLMDLTLPLLLLDCPIPTSSKLSLLMEMMLARLCWTATLSEFCLLWLVLLLGWGEGAIPGSTVKEPFGDWTMKDPLLLYNSSIFMFDILELRNEQIDKNLEKKSQSGIYSIFFSTGIHQFCLSSLNGFQINQNAMDAAYLLSCSCFPITFRPSILNMSCKVWSPDL